MSKLYRERYGMPLDMLAPDGRVVTCRKAGCPCQLPVIRRAHADALQQAVRWGEPYVFFLAPSTLTWVIPLVDLQELKGGLSGGTVIADHDPADRTAAVNYLAGAGCSRASARRFVSRLPTWPQSRTAEAAQYLFDLAYQVTALTPSLLHKNRENALQQRQIAESIHQRKTSANATYPMREERILLSLMRVGDRSGARRVLNDMLAAMFLYSPNPLIIRARAIEMMGFLVRAAIEESPVQEPLMNKHQEWIRRIVGARDFEELCEVLRYALDDFIDAISVQGYNRSCTHVQAILNYIGEHFAERIALDSIAEAVSLSRFHVAHIVKASTGRTLTQHIRGLRIEKACEWLDSTEKSYAQIAYDLGFADQSYFIKQFREMTGTTPARYRRARRG